MVFMQNHGRAEKYVQEDKKNMTCAISAWSQVGTVASISNVHGAMTLSSANAHGVQVLKNDIVCYIFLHKLISIFGTYGRNIVTKKEGAHSKRTP
jgi:hypothetical protein